jgi:very-short-patch-repair endonuclease
MRRAYRGCLRKEPDSLCADLARSQHGVISRSQALRIGLSSDAIARRLSRGRWETLYPRVYRVSGAPPSWRQTLFGACLWTGPDAVASHRSAAALWGLEGVRDGFVEITSSRRTKPPPELVLHVLPSLERCDVSKVDGIPATNVSRTLIDLGAVVGIEAVEAALDDALRRRLTSLPRVTSRLAEVGGNGRRGVGVLRKLLAERDPALAVPESVLEARLVHLLRRANLPEPTRQYEVRERGKLLARVDLAYPDCRLAIEADGYRYHSGRAAWQRDLKRRNVLTSRGWRVIHVTWADVTVDGNGIVSEIRRALGEPGQLRLG